LALLDNVDWEFDMPKFHGKIGYATTAKETAPGVWTDDIIEYEYTGDVLRNISKSVPSEGVNDNIVISNQFSIIGDWNNYDNFSSMKYIEYMNTKWKIVSVEVQRPRLIVTVGSVYNGPLPIVVEPPPEEVP
jgi:hypothetical protein